jgi:hypothetical protein
MAEHAATPLGLWGSSMLLARGLTVIVPLALQACAVVSTADGQRLRMTSPEFRAYVERVFREQNRVADEIAFALEEGPSQGDRLAAEQRLLEACALVNELATARRDDRRLGAGDSARAARTVPACEDATRSVAALLAEARTVPEVSTQ